MKHCKIGTAKTIGELKELIKDYPDETLFQFRNQAMQTLYELTNREGITMIYFDYKVEEK